MSFPNCFCQFYRSLKVQSAKGLLKFSKYIYKWSLDRRNSSILHGLGTWEREYSFGDSQKTSLETFDIFDMSIFLCFRVRRSSTWSAQQMPTWLSLSAGAAPLTRMRCSLGTRWTSATSVLWSKDRHFSFLQVFPGLLWEGLRKVGRGRELVALEPTPSHNVLIWLCEISLSYQLKAQKWTSRKFEWWPVGSVVSWGGPGGSW